MKSPRTPLILACALIVTVLIFVQASRPDQSTKETVIVKCNAVGAKGWSFIRIYRGDGTVEKIELERYTNTESDEANLKTIAVTLKKLNAEGFEVVSHNEIAMTAGTMNTFVMKK
jgi:hypothetical protein